MFDRAAAFEHSGLALDLVLERALNVPKRVQVLDLRLDAKWLPAAPHRYVGIAPEAAFFHVAVGHTRRDENRAHPAEVLSRLRRRTHVGMADDLDERHAAAIEIERRRPIRVGQAVVKRLSRVLLEVNPDDADAARRAT